MTPHPSTSLTPSPQGEGNKPNWEDYRIRPSCTIPSGKGNKPNWEDYRIRPSCTIPSGKGLY